MRVSPAAIHLRESLIGQRESQAGPPVLVADGPRAILGGRAGDDGVAAPIVPRLETLFGARGACLAAAGGPLFVCDTGHHRPPIWTCAPSCDQAQVDVRIGQPDFMREMREGRNAKSAVGATILNVPTGVAGADDVLALADAWNHRVRIWHGHLATSNRHADVVLGHSDFTGGLANRGANTARADPLNWCYGVAIVDRRLIVADTGNRRVLVWDRIPTPNGTPADLVMGQRDFVTRDENEGEGVGALGMRWLQGIAVVDGMILVSDEGNNRMMIWRALPRSNGAPCDFVIGQADVMGLDDDRAAYYPTAAALAMPHGLAVQGQRLVVADTANSRLVGFEMDAVAMRAGRHGFTDKGDNRWGLPVRDGLCCPYGVASCGDTSVIADSTDNRVLLREAAP
jgi:hypothetical protein